MKPNLVVAKMEFPQLKARSSRDVLQVFVERVCLVVVPIIKQLLLEITMKDALHRHQRVSNQSK